MPVRDDFRELPDVPAQWVRPAIVVEVEYRQKNGAGLRHAVLKGIRPDQRAGQARTSKVMWGAFQMAEQENIDALMRVLDGFNRNDIEAASEGLDPDVTYIIRGRASVSGTYRGPEAFASALRRIKELTGGTMIGKPEVVLAKGDEIMMYMRVTGSRPDGRKYDNHQAYLYRFRNGKLLEGQTIPVDQHAFEEFLA